MNRHVLKKFISFALTLVILIGMGAPGVRLKVSAAEIPGTSVTWAFNDGTLTIGGSGAMPDSWLNNGGLYPNPDNRPWAAHITSITTVDIGDGVTSIGKGAFYGCVNLTSVTMPSVTSIGERAFVNCAKLTSEGLSIPSGVTFINLRVFEGCVGLTSVTIPAGVTFIASNAFDGCNNLYDIYFDSATPPNEVQSHAFSGVKSGARAILPDGSTAYGRPGSIWRGLRVVVNIEGQPTLELPDYTTETIEVTVTGDDIELSWFSYVVEVNGKVTRVEPLYGNKIDISKLIPKEGGKPVQIAVIYNDAVPDTSKTDLSRYDVVSNTVKLLERGTKMTKAEVSINYAAETVTGTGKYDYRTTHGGEWNTITLGAGSSIDISGFSMGGTLEMRKSATDSKAAGPILKVKIKNRPNPPALIKIKVDKGAFKGVTEKMEYSVNGGLWTTVPKPFPTERVSPGTILFRVKATDKAMKSMPTAFTYNNG